MVRSWLATDLVPQVNEVRCVEHDYGHTTDAVWPEWVMNGGSLRCIIADDRCNVAPTAGVGRG